MRVVLAVAVTLALFAVAAPAAADAREHRSDRVVATDLTALERAGTALLGLEAPTPSPATGPRRFVTLRVPGESLTTASVDWVALGGRPDVADRDPHVVAYALAGGDPRTVELPFRLVTDADGPLVLEGSGRYELRLTLALDGVHVDRVEV
ncbi:DUF7311 family protein [Haloarchaeobius salinus]|uniref:DUF7311 family protein n=1 Tax=Haloarchaeobius salinus TaxID=1198298 RepID=UPI00210C850A|nr:hypothetical protein [Haloarchaeobius salinus]